MIPYDLVLTATSALPFLPALFGGFVFDDWESVVNNPVVNGKAPWTDVLWRDYWGRDLASPRSHKSFRPLTTLLFRLQWSWFNRQAQLFHVVGIGLHVAVCLVLYRALRELETKLVLKRSLAKTNAFLFALHPVHTEAVANISCQAELLSALVVLIGLQFYISRCQQLSVSNFLLLSVLSIAAVTSKEQGIALLPMCAGLAVLLGRKTQYIVLVLASIAVTLGRMRIGGEPPQFSVVDNPAAFVEAPVFRYLSFAWQWLIHLKLLVAPLQLCFDYSMGCILPILTTTDPRILVLLTVGILAPYILYKLFVSSNEGTQRLIAFATLFGCISFFPASNLLVTVGFTVAERVLYLPSIGFCLLVSIIWRRLEKIYGKMDSHALAIVLVAALLCFQRSQDWMDELSLYSSGLKVCPNNAKIHYNLAKILTDQRRETEAEKEYREAIRLHPHYEQALNNLGNLLEKKGRFNESESFLRAAVTQQPSFAAAWMNLGITTMHAGKFNESIFAYKESLRYRPNSADCLFNLGNLYQKMADLEKAVMIWEEAIRINLGHCTSWTNIFVALDELGRCDQVLSQESHAMSHCSPVPAVRSQLGVCHAQMRSFSRAEEHLLAAIALSPTSQVYRSNYDVFLSLKATKRRRNL